ncbi:Cytochrome c1 heme lyase [Tulasnella sp. 403]|nr:Cytochrome c1 heme lyase [Tulasnella sp. 403]
MSHVSSSDSEPPASSSKCPVDHSTREKWAKLNAGGSSSPHPTGTAGLPTEREISSIPRADGEKWVYPSQSQFYDAMARKSHNPRADDMRVVVPIHNAVNERAWREVLQWEAGKGGEACGGVKLVSFKGDASKLSPKARLKMLFGLLSTTMMDAAATLAAVAIAANALPATASAKRLLFMPVT